MVVTQVPQVEVEETQNTQQSHIKDSRHVFEHRINFGNAVGSPLQSVNRSKESELNGFSTVKRATKLNDTNFSRSQKHISGIRTNENNITQNDEILMQPKINPYKNTKTGINNSLKNSQANTLAQSISLCETSGHRKNLLTNDSAAGVGQAYQKQGEQIIEMSEQKANANMNIMSQNSFEKHALIEKKKLQVGAEDTVTVVLQKDERKDTAEHYDTVNSNEQTLLLIQTKTFVNRSSMHQKNIKSAHN